MSDPFWLTEAQLARIKSCQKRWCNLTKDESVNLKAGMAASYLALARKKAMYGGRIGFCCRLRRRSPNLGP